MTRISLAETAHQIVRQHLQAGSVAIDATLGNGHDTVFLAEIVGGQGGVFGFDVQQQALASTRNRLLQSGLLQRVKMIHASHADMLQHIPLPLHGHIQAIMFNLGYLPGADKGLITQVDSTLTAVDAACRMLAKDGVLTIMAYPGHDGGDEESRRLEAWRLKLAQTDFHAEVVFSRHPKATAPRLFVIRKRA